VIREIEDTGKADGIYTVADLFWNVWNAHEGYVLPGEEHTDKCFTFDVCSRRFPHIVRHGDEEAQEGERIVLHSVRDLNTLVLLPRLSAPHDTARHESHDTRAHMCSVHAQEELDPKPFAVKYGWDVVNRTPLSDVLAQLGDGEALPSLGVRPNRVCVV
jgi:hypothetical protein